MSGPAPISIPWHRREDTRVTVDACSARGGDLATALEGLGIDVRRGRSRIVADSTTVGGQAVKVDLRGRGFADREYEVVVELVRQRGIL